MIKLFALTGTCVVRLDTVSSEGRQAHCDDWVSAWCHFRPRQQPTAIQTSEKGALLHVLT